MSDGYSSMKICPLGNTQEMFKSQIRSYPIKIYAETSLIPKLNRTMKEENLRKSGQRCKLRNFAVIHVSQGHCSKLFQTRIYLFRKRFTFLKSRFFKKSHFWLRTENNALHCIDNVCCDLKIKNWTLDYVHFLFALWMCNKDHNFFNLLSHS